MADITTDTEDEDYNPDDEEDEEEDDEEDEEEDDEEDEEEEDKYKQQNIFLILNPTKNRNINKKRHISQSIYDNKKIKKKKYTYYKQYNSVEKEYFNQLSAEEKDNIELQERNLVSIKTENKEPLRFKFLRLDIPDRNKKMIISKIEMLNKMEQNINSEYYKLYNWVNVLNTIPFNNYYELPVKNTDDNNSICNFLENIHHRMNETIYGHKEAKEQIVRILAQLISFPKANGYIIGIQGSAGVGKTKLIKEGICNALNYPFAFISLGGVEDSSYLRGHSYTYEGATYGKICESLIKTGIMNPLILFDELDKVSNTHKGQEIINTLIHITDPVQNDKFNDRYFEELDLNISRSMIVFTYNDENLINPILKDRMIVINVSGYNQNEKLILAKNYLIPEILKQYNLKNTDIIFDNEIIKYIIENEDKEDGVRNLKRAINNTISWVNMMRYILIDNNKITFPFEVSVKFYDKYCRSNKNMNNNKLHFMYI